MKIKATPEGAKLMLEQLGYKPGTCKIPYDSIRIEFSRGRAYAVFIEKGVDLGFIYLDAQLRVGDSLTIGSLHGTFDVVYGPQNKEQA